MRLVRREALRYIPGVAGMDRRDVLGSDVLPGVERLRGMSMTRNRRPGPGIKDGAPGDPRDTVKLLNCLKPNLQMVQMPARRKDTRNRRRILCRSRTLAGAPSGSGAMSSEDIKGDEWAA
jgi:hypothetical protein